MERGDVGRHAMTDPEKGVEVNVIIYVHTYIIPLISIQHVIQPRDKVDLSRLTLIIAFNEAR